MATVNGRNTARGPSSSSLTAVAATVVIVMFIISSLIAVFCVLSACLRRHRVDTAPPRHLVPGSTALPDDRPVVVGYLRSPGRPMSFYSDTVCPIVKSSWVSTSDHLSQLWSASQIGSRHSSMFPSRQIQPIRLHYYNDF